jgi:hypothetical protein
MKEMSGLCATRNDGCMTWRLVADTRSWLRGAYVIRPTNIVFMTPVCTLTRTDSNYRVHTGVTRELYSKISCLRCNLALPSIVSFKFLCQVREMRALTRSSPYRKNWQKIVINVTLQMQMCLEFLLELVSNAFFLCVFPQPILDKDISQIQHI